MALGGNWLEKFNFNISYTLTKYGFCRTFNMLDNEEMFHDDSTAESFTAQEYQEIRFRKKKYQQLVDDQLKPLKTTNKDLGINGVLFRPHQFQRDAPNVSDTFYFMFHSYAELPVASSRQFILTSTDRTSFLVTPQLKKIDESLIGMNPKM